MKELSSSDQRTGRQVWTESIPPLPLEQSKKKNFKLLN